MAKEGMEGKESVEYWINSWLASDVALIQSKTDFNAELEKKFLSLALNQKKKIGKTQCEKLKKQIYEILENDDPETRRSCCAMLYGLADFLTQQLYGVK